MPSDLKCQIVSDVSDSLSAEGAPHRYGIGLGGISLDLAMPIVEQAAKAAEDLAVATFGTAVDAIVQSQRDKIRAVLSQSVLDFVKTMATELAAVKAS